MSRQKIPVTFGSRESAATWAKRLEEISESLADQGFTLAAEDVEAAADWLRAFAEAR